MILCPQCQCSFEPSSRQIYCSRRCKERATKARNRIEDWGKKFTGSLDLRPTRAKVKEASLEDFTETLRKLQDQPDAAGAEQDSRPGAMQKCIPDPQE